MQRQLALARMLAPLLVQQQLRHQVIQGHSSIQLSIEANQLANQAIDSLQEQIEHTVEELLTQFALDENGAVSLGEWQAAWKSHPEITMMFGGMLQHVDA